MIIRPSILKCNHAHLRQPHGAHEWEPQPGMTPVHCPGHLDIGKNRQRAQAAAEGVRCCVCGGGQVVYRNYLEQPFCGLCANCECAQNPCVRTGVGDPTVSESAEVERLRRMVRQLMTVNRRHVGKLEAALARVGELAARIEAGHPVQDNPGNLAAAIRDAARTSQPKEKP
ncbi:hypothetical protein ABT099_23615 [Streptomyces prasinus]|uniref:hypothetical protein n=1 Tax=Streptomyces prasinus TaxID=67345 RepID=UPI00332A4844